jgi:hypothetical protein
VALTLTEAQQLRADYYAALRALASGKSYTIGSRTLTRADEKFVRDEFNRYDAIVDQLNAGVAPGGARAIRVVPRDL